jgi:hypothetical protein
MSPQGLYMAARTPLAVPAAAYQLSRQPTARLAGKTGTGWRGRREGDLVCEPAFLQAVTAAADVEVRHDEFRFSGPSGRWSRPSLPEAVVEFPQLPVFTIHAGAPVYFESAVAWTDQDVVTGKRKMNLIFETIDKDEKNYCDLCTPGAQLRRALEARDCRRSSARCRATGRRHRLTAADERPAAHGPEARWI